MQQAVEQIDRRGDGSLEAIDALAATGQTFANVADIGTGTGLLAFAALALWPSAKAIATDIDPVAIDVARDNAVSHLDGERQWTPSAAT